MGVFYWQVVTQTTTKARGRPGSTRADSERYRRIATVTYAACIASWATGQCLWAQVDNQSGADQAKGDATGYDCNQHSFVKIARTMSDRNCAIRRVRAGTRFASAPANILCSKTL